MHCPLLLAALQAGSMLIGLTESALIVVNIPLGINNYTWCLNALLCPPYGNNIPLCSHLTLTHVSLYNAILLWAEAPHAGLPFYIELP